MNVVILAQRTEKLAMNYAVHKDGSIKTESLLLRLILNYTQIQYRTHLENNNKLTNPDYPFFIPLNLYCIVRYNTSKVQYGKVI